MKCTALRCPAQIRAAIVFVAALLWIAAAEASERPQYGGVLRVELRASSVATNPQKWKLGSPELANNERLAALLFDRLVALDDYGRFQPQLATEWTHDGAAKRWQEIAEANRGTLSDPEALSAGMKIRIPSR